MDNEAVVFYLSREKPVGVPDGQLAEFRLADHCFYVRAEWAPLHYDEALDLAAPQKGESVMNSHPLPAPSRAMIDRIKR